ncbi:MAG: DUF6055 domain-containing protein [Acidobacteria bacterium]|nr:DUF6055 domain-containing protein [Acidobacteriota bacterium]
MGNKKESGKLLPALLVGFAALFIVLTSCRGCRSKKEEAEKKTPVPVAAKAMPAPAKQLARPKRAPNAHDKILAAERAGRLDLDTAWTYKIQALVDQNSLPQEFRSPERIPCGTPTLKGLAAMHDRLKPETQEKLRPYLLRPTHPESIFFKRLQAKATSRRAPAAPGTLYAQDVPEPQRPTKGAPPGQWVRAQCSNGPISVWSAIGFEAASRAATLIDSKRMWTEFDRIMPVPAEIDAGARNEYGELDQDEDHDLDIYLVPTAMLTDDDGRAKGWCRFIRRQEKQDANHGDDAPKNESGRPTWIMIDQSLQGDELGATLAHEIFHSFQYAVTIRQQPWWDESTAVWAEEFIGPKWDWAAERGYLTETFDDTTFRLKTINGEEGLHPYAAYIFPYYMACRFGEEFIGKVWSACGARGGDAMDAVESQLAAAGLELKEAWKEFALMNYDDNKDYGRKYHETLDTHSYHYEDTILLRDKSEVQEIELPPLSAFYFVVTNSGIDADKFPGVHFNLEELEKKENVTVQAVVLKDGDFRVEDWTGQKEHDFCLKNEADRFDEIDLIVASHERKETLKDLKVPIELGYLAQCDVDWTGTLTFSATYQCDDSKEGEWRRSGAWRAGTSGPWEDQFSKFDLEQKNSFRATASVNLRLKTQLNKTESEEEKEMMEGLNRLFGGAVYIQEGVTGSCGISYHQYSKQTTTYRPPGKSTFVSSDAKAGGGGALSRYGMSALSGPRLTVYPEKGEYTLEIDFSAPDVPGTTTIESSGGGSQTNSWTWDGGKPLFASYQWRTDWATSALKGTYSGDLISGHWKSPPRKKPKDGGCASPGVAVADITVNWTIRKVK